MKLPPTIQLHDLSTGYRSRREEKVISQHLELTITPGEVVMLMGPNGSGKSTLMHTMAGLLTPLSGEVIISGKPLSSLKMKEHGYSASCSRSASLRATCPSQILSLWGATPTPASVVTSALRTR